MGCAYVVVDARLLECDLVRLTLGQGAGVPVAYFALVERRSGVWDIPNIGESHGRPRLDAGAGRPIAVFHIVVGDFNAVDPLGDRSARPGNRRRRWRRPQRAQLSLQRKGPYRVTVGAALDRVAARGDGDVLLAVDLVDRCGGVGTEAGLEFPQHVSSLGVDRDKV